MREELIRWILSCNQALQSKYANSPNVILLLNSFLGQFDSSACALINHKPSRLDKGKFFVKRLLGRGAEPLSPYKPDLKGSESDMLFWPWMKTHAKQMKTIVQPLAEHTELKVAVLSHNHLQQGMLKTFNNESKLGFTQEEYDLSETANKFDFKRICKSLLQEAKALPVFEYGSVKIPFAEVLEHALQLHPHFFYVMELYRDLKSKLNFRGLFVGNDLTLQGRTAVLLAQQDDIWTSSIMHGALKNPLWNHILVDTFFVFGKKDVKSLDSVEQSDIILAGSPQVDEVRSRRTDDRKGQGILVAFSGAGHSISLPHHLEMISELENAAREMKAKFLLRLHPKDSVSFYENLIKLPNVEVVDSNSEDIYQSLLNAKVLITSASMTALDAMLLEVPVVTLDFQNEVGYVDFISVGATKHVTHKGELISMLSSILTSTECEREDIFRKQGSFLEESFETKKEGSSQFIAQYIDQKLRDAS